MSLLRLYGRVLGLLGPEARLGFYLAIANVALAGAGFAEPVLFGRIIDALAGSQARSAAAAWSDLSGLLAAWVGFGLFTIVCGVTVALHADRLAHRRRQAVLAGFFDHVLQLPLSFHNTAHSGRLMKIMLSGTDALWILWLDFFRDSYAAAVSLAILLPLSLYLNWALGVVLIVVCVVFAFLTGLVINKTEVLQGTVERHYSNLAERASDALGNVALVQGFARVEAEGHRPAQRRRPAAGGADPGAVVVGRGGGAHPRLDHAHAARHLPGRRLPASRRARHDRRDRDVHEFRRRADRPAREGGALRQQGVHGRAAAQGILHRARHRSPRCATRPDAIDPGRVRGLVEFKDATFPMTASALPSPISISRRCRAKP